MSTPVSEHPDLPWPPTEAEKGYRVRRARDRPAAPARPGVLGGTAGTTRRYFHVKLPVALGSERAVLVYADPGHDTATALRSWDRAHRDLWRALRALGRSVEAVVVARMSRQIERGIIEGSVEILDQYGGLQAAMQRSVALEREARRQRRMATIHRASAWRTARLQGVRYLMRGGRSTTVGDRAIDAGGRCALWRSPDAHGGHGGSPPVPEGRSKAPDWGRSIHSPPAGSSGWPVTPCAHKSR